MSAQKHQRPVLGEALAAWKQHLAGKKLPSECRWIFAENLCAEPSTATPGEVRIGYQTCFSPASDDALEMAYDIFSETDAPLIFYRLGTSNGQSICLLLCDSWFESKTTAVGYETQPGWGISFFAGQPGEVEEITDLARWLRREKGRRNPHALDFAMSLATIDEVKIHGRTLMPYERFAETMMTRLRRILGQ